MWRAAIRFPVRQFHPVRFSPRYFIVPANSVLVFARDEGDQ
jgi:hypothetical protein